MNRRPRILSFPAAVVTFFKSLRLSSATDQYPRRAPQTSLVASHIQMTVVDMEVEYSDLANNGFSKATADDEQGLDADATRLPPLSELKIRSKLPLSMIASPIMESWDSAALEHSSRETNTTHSCSEDAEYGYELDEDDMHFGTESATSAESQSGPPLPSTRSVSPEPTLGFKSLSPPPWHFRARRQNAWRYANINTAAEAEVEAEDEQGACSDGHSLCQQFEQPTLSAF